MAASVLYLIRHSKAEVHHPGGDRFRSLSAEGRDRVLGLLPEAQGLGLRADLALSSPYLRALQTRELFQPVVRAPRHAESGAFTPDSDPQDAVAELAAWASEGSSSIALFTHNPLVTDLAWLLLEKNSLSTLTFHTPTILALTFEAGIAPRQARPLWILHP